jgi:hypothetical protein
MRRDLIDRLESSVPFLEEERVVLSMTGEIYEAMIDQAVIDTRNIDGSILMKIPAELMILDWEISQSIQ